MPVIIKVKAYSFLEKTFPKILTKAHRRLIFGHAFMSELLHGRLFGHAFISELFHFDSSF